MTLCGFCLDERGPCAHPECPFGASEPIGPAASLPERPPTRPSVVGQAAAAVLPAPVVGHANPRAPHIATAPSVVSREGQR